MTKRNIVFATAAAMALGAAGSADADTDYRHVPANNMPPADYRHVPAHNASTPDGLQAFLECARGAMLSFNAPTAWSGPVMSIERDNPEKGTSTRHVKNDSARTSTTVSVFPLSGDYFYSVSATAVETMKTGDGSVSHDIAMSVSYPEGYSLMSVDPALFEKADDMLARLEGELEEGCSGVRSARELRPRP